MNLNIKNNQIKEAIIFENRNKMFKANNGNAYKNSTPEQIGLNFMLGYVTSLAEIAEDPSINLGLDLTYKTVGNLMAAVAYEYVAGMNSEYTEKQNIVIAEKTIAAYLTFLAANEHNLKIKVKRMKTLTPELIQDSRYWTGHEIIVESTMIKKGLLPAISGRVKCDGKVLTVHMEDIIKTYKQLTSVDLMDMGVDSMEAVLPDSKK